MLRVGVIGCGGMGRDHIRRLTEKIQGAEVVAVSDVFEESARKAAEICGARQQGTDQRRGRRCSIYRISGLRTCRFPSPGN